MINNRKYLLVSILYCSFLSYVLFWGFGYMGLGLYELIFGSPRELGVLMYGVFGLYSGFLGIFISWIVFFLTNKFWYKKLKADFNFKKPVFYTNIIIFVIGQILFYLSLVVLS